MRRIAVIGFGNIARKHIEVFRAHGCQIIASCNRSESSNYLASAEIGIPVTYQDYHKMITETKPEGILVCVSFWSMYKVLRDIIPYGIPILAEKPTGTSLAEHFELLSLSTTHQTPVMVGLNRRHYSVLNRAIEEAGGKEVITSVSVEWSENPLHLIKNRKLTDDQIKKYIFGNSIHGIDLMLWVGGEMTDYSVYYHSYSNDNHRVMMNISGKSKSGKLCQFSSSWDNPVPWRLVLTSRFNRFVLAPLEECNQFTEGLVGSKRILPSTEDTLYKAGFYAQTKKFIEGRIEGFDLTSVTPSMRMAEILTKKLFD